MFPFVFYRFFASLIVSSFGFDESRCRQSFLARYLQFLGIVVRMSLLGRSGTSLLFMAVVCRFGNLGCWCNGSTGDGVSSIFV